ncbi:MAG: hypothetical protein IKZ12_06030 [Alistipes sp.]|nr:hypothetical protein [Alistipes sp.]
MKKIATLLLAIATVATATAGGPMTNSNQSAAFLRHIARGTTLDTDAVYNNPAGTAFMEDGWHLGINNQMAMQTRTTQSFAKHGDLYPGGFDEREYKGEVFSPAVPSFHLTWKKDRFALMLGMGVNGGGGEIEYKNGLASFERMFSVLPTAMAQIAPVSDYQTNMYLKGKSMTLAFNAGVSFRITDWLSAAAMIRYSTTSNGYEGYLKNTNVKIGGNWMPAANVFNQAYSQLEAQMQQALAVYGEAFLATPQGQQLVAGMTAVGTGAAQTADHVLDVKQTGNSISPVLALYAQKGAWAASVKYEFKMDTELKIESAEVSAKDPVINSIFTHGDKVKSETPALLAVAASRQCGPVKVSAEWHMYFDKDAENSFTQTIKSNTQEYLLGAEWQINEKWLVSCGVQRTQLDMEKELYSDMNFSLPSWSTAIGVAYSFSDHIRLNAGVMPTFYEDLTVKGDVISGGTKLGNYQDVYGRTSMAWGLGLDFKF